MRLRLLLVLRQVYRHPFQVLLNILGVALGVSVVLAVDLTNSSAERAFIQASRQVSSSVTHRIINDSAWLDEGLFVRLRSELGIRGAFPVVNGWVQGPAGQRLRLTGIDPLSFSELPGTRAFQVLSMADLLLSGTALAGSDLGNVFEGNQIEVSAGNSTYTLELSQLEQPQEINPGNVFSDGLLVDISTAQMVLGKQGLLSHIDLVLDKDQAAALGDMLPPGIQLVEAGTSSATMDQMTRAFRINLQALSLLALLIGAFLIYNTMTISVLQRRDQIATLRATGLTGMELVSLLVLELAVVAVAGIIAGCILGTTLSQFLVKLVSQTMSDLYFIDQVQSVYLSTGSYIKAILLGILTVLGATMLPVRDALNIPPEIARSRSRLEKQTIMGHARFLIAALVLILPGIVMLLVKSKDIYSGFVALAFIVLSLAMLIPPGMVLLLRMLEGLLYRVTGIFGLVACRNVLSSLSRTQVAVTALAIAVSATIGVSIMISSFRLSVQEWLSDALQADIYISIQRDSRVDDISNTVLHEISSLPGVTRIISTYWRDFSNADRTVQASIRDLEEQDFQMFRFLDGANPARWETYSTADSVIVSEPYAYHNDIVQGDQVELQTDTGMHSFTVAGIFRDYSSDRGIIGMHADVYRKYWSEYHVSSLALYLQSGLDSFKLSSELNRGLLHQDNLLARPTGQLRDLSMQIFDRTFAVTEVLRMITVIIAVAGILGALTAIQMERGREFAILRASGMTPLESFRLIWMESGLIGMLAGIMAIPLGLIMAALLIFIINRRSFGWSMELALAPGYLVSAVVLGLAAGLLAGTWPAWRQSSRLPAMVLRDE